MFINNTDFILTEEKAEKIARKIEVLRIKQTALTTIAALLEPHDGKVLNARVFKEVKKAYDSKDLFVFFDWREYSGALELRLYGQALTHSESQCFFISDSIKKGDRLNYEGLRAEMWKKSDSYGMRIAETEKALKTLKSQLKKACAAFETLRNISESLPYEIKDEFKIFREIY